MVWLFFIILFFLDWLDLLLLHVIKGLLVPLLFNLVHENSLIDTSSTFKAWCALSITLNLVLVAQRDGAIIGNSAVSTNKICKYLNLLLIKIGV